MSRCSESFTDIIKRPGLARVCTYALALDVKASNRLLQGFFKGPPNRHHLAGALHLRADALIRCLELVKRPSGDFCHNIIEGRLKACRCGLCNIVLYLVKPEAYSDLCRDLRNRIPSRLRRKRAAPADTGIYLDNIILPLHGIYSELHVATAFNLKGSDNFERR
ncbi:hypothetical protein BMS3Bbin16_01104 [archaeon BMS3Bbin16]|nr:hypothetical protein BMS3Bbin16_01104 [archaeon BMS3Bbin16]